MRRYLVVGHTGVGKSSLINTIFGDGVASVAPFDACTKEVKHYIYTTRLGPIDLIDTPGLGEHTPGQNAEDTSAHNSTYLDLVSKEIAQQPINVMLYVSRLDNTRLYPAEEKVLELITKHIGAPVWQGSWLALTHAASIPEERFEAMAQKRIEQVSTFLQNLTSTYRKEKYTFTHFARVLLIDNLQSWNTYALPTTALQGFVWKRLSPEAIMLHWQEGV